MQLQRSSLLIPGLFALLLVHAPAEAQSFGSATWIRQAWISGDRFIPMDITVGPHKEVFVTGVLSEDEDAWFEASADSADVRMLDTPHDGGGFLVRYDGETGNLGFVKPGSVLIVEPPSIVSLYTRGHSVAVVDGRLFHGEGLGPNEHSRTGSAMVTVRDLEGSVQYRIGPRERTTLGWSIFMQGIRFDAQGNLYLAGTYTDTLYFSPDVVLAPSRRFHHHTWDVFVASYAPDGMVRWAHHVEGGTGDLWISNGWYGRAAFDVDAAGNMVLGAVANGVPPPPFSAAEDGVVLAYYSSSDGALQRIQTLNDLGISYKPTFSTLRNHMGPIYRVFASDYVPYPDQIRRDKSGNMYVLWRKATIDDWGINSLTVSDTTLHHREEAYMRVLTKFDAQGTLLWARKLDNHYVLYPGGLEVAENGHVYVWGNFWGRYVEFEGVRLTQDEAEGFDGFVAHYDESGHLVRALHLETTGDGDHFVEALAIGTSGDVYVGGRFGTDRAILGADTLYAQGRGNLFVAKYGATSLSSEPSVEVPSGAIKVSNYPNPFRQGATIEYRVPTPGHVRLTVYDVLGRELAVLVDERQSAGSHSAKLDASSWPSGVYLYRLEVGNQVATGRLVRHK
ncbi:MAG: T9SS type A sorting domain-containing protein [Rhodothermaceae bacterium]|nr:T9SS type A sorting domain-containing protein [Rhodothermaceae bacterium]MYI85005.1 T9SS type A sorting domain-containing protein [Rhodothermaceae bacterium]